MNGALVYIVDDDASVRDSMSLFLSLKGYTTRMFDSAEGILSILPLDASIACALIDLRMPGLSGLALQQELSHRAPGLPVIVITAHGDVATARQALKAGAVDFLEKPVDHAMLIESIEAALQSHSKLRQKESGSQTYRARLERLTPRERQVMELLANGIHSRDIGAQLQISPRTVEVYKARLMEKLQTRNVADIIRMAIASN